MNVILPFLFRCLGHVPLRWLHRLGALAGWAVYGLSPRYRRHLRENLAQAGLAAELRLEAAAEAGKQVLELARIWTKPLAEANALVVAVTGWTHVEAARAAGKGILFLTPHLGCFEISAQYYSAFGEITVLYRPPRQAGLEALIATGRRRARLHLAPADLAGVRLLMRALKRGDAVGILPDQAPKKGEGAWLDFFGRSAHTMTLAARLSELGPAVLLVRCERLPAGRGFHLHFLPPAQPLAGDTLARAAAINHEIEALIRQCPTQYLWGYNRYKGARAERAA
ncbi:MAG: lysophospholipid acyltransferase family protein [Zoogloeaceae bacterium]|jgi:KDO2-lipid IV(A) lauroyltransferase|nr:lysophospholipid acyltransferase family protein [Zoogloeaceae bacterium]